MVFHCIHIHNFLSIKDITLPLDNQGLVLINGVNLDNNSLNNNGAGKSAILEALVFALYGKTIRGLKGDAVVHHLVGKDMKVELDITDDDGVTYRVIRHRGHPVNKNKSLLYRDGVDITPKSEVDFDRYITNLLQADYDTFTASLLYSAESFKFATATDGDIKRAFDTMLGLDILSRALEVTRGVLKETARNIHAAQSTITDCDKQLQQLGTRLQQTTESQQQFEADKTTKTEQLRQSIIVLQEKHQNLLEEQGTLQSQLQMAEAAWVEAKEQVRTQDSELEQVDKLRDELKQVEQEHRELTQRQSLCDKTITTANKRIEQLQKSINSAQVRVTKLEQKKQDLVKQIGQPCPTCGAPLTSEGIEPARQEYDEQISELQQDITNTQLSIQNLEDDICVQHQQIANIGQQLQELLDTKREFQQLLEQCKPLEDERVAAINHRDSTYEEMVQLRAQLQVKQSELTHNRVLLQQIEDTLTATVATENPYGKLLMELQTEQQQLQDKAAAATSRVGVLEQKERCLKFWETAYSNRGIKSRILDDITPYLNRRINRYLTKLAAGQIEATFSTQTVLKSGDSSDKFSLTVTNRDGGGHYSANSSGEKKRIDLAINLALQDLVASRSSKKINIAIFDEVFDALDENGIDSVVSLLQDLAAEKSTILVVTHNEHLKSHFNNCITIVKHHGFSHLEEASDR